jgi:transcriptional regulator of aromatic amino acid metabolism
VRTAEEHANGDSITRTTYVRSNADFGHGSVGTAPRRVRGVDNGVGKQVLAEAIYRLDPKRNRRGFMVVHCGTLQESLAESELFGHRRGAFSGAFVDRRGLFQSAHFGTVFLDDVNCSS